MTTPNLVPAFGADRDANGQLARPSRDGKRQHAVDTARVSSMPMTMSGKSGAVPARYSCPAIVNDLSQGVSAVHVDADNRVA